MTRLDLDRVEEMLPRPPWWLWPGFLVLLAIAAFSAARALQPGPDEVCTLLGHRLGAECAFVTVTGHPCPSCGMTRSFVWGARGHFWRAASYNPGGLTLFLWIQAGGIVGLTRLVRRAPRALTPPLPLLLAWTLVWLVGLYAVPWLLRLAGINPLP